jgi:hypothetical protein
MTKSPFLRANHPFISIGTSLTGGITELALRIR